MLEFLKIQMLQRMQDQDERNRVEAEERRIHQEQMQHQQQMMMLLVANSLGQGNSVTNLASRNLSIANSTQMSNLPASSPISVALLAHKSSKSSASIFLVRSELPI